MTGARRGTAGELSRRTDRPTRAQGEIVLTARRGHSLPPIAIAGARGWVSGYVVPVMSGALDGTIRVGDETLPLSGGTGYHDHNWGFWEGVSWQWGQVQHEGLSILYGRVFPPADAADASRVPGFMMVLGPDGPLGQATRVTIDETIEPTPRPAGPDHRPRQQSVTRPSAGDRRRERHPHTMAQRSAGQRPRLPADARHDTA